MLITHDIGVENSGPLEGAVRCRTARETANKVLNTPDGFGAEGPCRFVICRRKSSIQRAAICLRKEIEKKRKRKKWRAVLCAVAFQLVGNAAVARTNENPLRRRLSAFLVSGRQVPMRS